MIRAVTIVGLATIALCGVAVSFAGLYGLALLCAFPPALAGLVPVLVDAGAGVASVVWLAGDVPDTARRYARRLALGLLAVSVVGNAGSHALAATGARPHWVVAVLVGALAPAVLAAVIHLSALVKAGGARLAGAASRVRGPVLVGMPGFRLTEYVMAGPPADASEVAPPGASVPDGVAEPVVRLALADPTGDDEEADEEAERLAKARELAAAGVGRPTLVKELGLPEHVAREIVRKHKPRQEGSA